MAARFQGGVKVGAAGQGAGLLQRQGLGVRAGPRRGGRLSDDLAFPNHYRPDRGTRAGAAEPLTPDAGGDI